MQFTVVIATYNRRVLLERALASVLAQTLPCQTIVVDDASGDDTAEAIADWSQRFGEVGRELIYWCNAANAGHSASVNRGVELARGQWIKLLDDDDYLQPQCLAVMAEAIAAHTARFVPGDHPLAAICSCQSAQVTLDGVEVGRTPRTGPGRAYYIPQEDIHYGMLLEIVPFGTPVQVAFRRQAFLAAKGWNSAFDTNFDDIDAWVRIARFGDAIFINECLACRTLWEGGINQKFSIETRYRTNWSVKQKIHDLVNPRYRSTLPATQVVRDYLQLHWAMVALKSGHWREALRLWQSAAWSLPGWRLVVATRWERAKHGLAWCYRDGRAALRRYWRRRAASRAHPKTWAQTSSLSKLSDLSNLSNLSDLSLGGRLAKEYRAARPPARRVSASGAIADDPLGLPGAAQIQWRSRLRRRWLSLRWQRAGLEWRNRQVVAAAWLVVDTAWRWLLSYQIQSEYFKQARTRQDDLADTRAYLRWQWAAAAWHHGQWTKALGLVFLALPHWRAWPLFWPWPSSVAPRLGRSGVRKVVLLALPKDHSDQPPFKATD